MGNFFIKAKALLFVIILFNLLQTSYIYADECNLELVQKDPYGSVYVRDRETGEFVKQDVNKRVKMLDQILFLQMDKNIDLYIEYVESMMPPSTLEEYNKFYEKNDFLESVKLPCLQKKKIMENMWKDIENEGNTDYEVVVNSKKLNGCSGRLRVPKRKVQYSKKYKFCKSW